MLTNDGDIVNKILRAGNNHKKEYIVTVNRTITDDFLTKMSNGVPILDRVTRKCKMQKITPNIFQITLTQGLNRQIRRMCEYFDYQVTKLERIQVLNIKLGSLKQGTWRNLTIKELDELFNLIEASDNQTKNSTQKPKQNRPKQVAKANNINYNKKDNKANKNPNSKYTKTNKHHKPTKKR